MLSRLANRLGRTGSFQLFQLFRYTGLLVTGIFLAKSGLSREEIGEYEILLLISGAVSFFWIGGLFNSFLPLYKKAPFDQRNSLTLQVYLTSLTINILITALLFILEVPLARVLSHSDQIPWYRLLLVFILFNNPGYLAEYMLMVREKNRHLIIYGLVYFSLQVILICAPVYLGYGIEGAIKGLAIAAFLRFTVMTGAMLVGGIFVKPDFKGAINLAGTASPLMLSLFLGGVATYVDGFLVSSHYSTAQLAIFQYGAREFPLVLLLANAFSSAMIPSVTANTREAVLEIRDKSRRLMHLLMPLSMVLLVASKWLYPFVFSPEFAESYIIFNIYILLISSRLLFPQTILTGLGKNKILLFASFIELLINVGLSLFLMQYYGVMGIAFATVIAFMADKLILIILLKKEASISITEYTDLKIYFAYCLPLLICFYFSTINPLW